MKSLKEPSSLRIHRLKCAILNTWLLLIQFRDKEWTHKMELLKLLFLFKIKKVKVFRNKRYALL